MLSVLCPCIVQGPGTAPTNLNVQSRSSDGLTLSWTNLDFLDWNGEFLYFLVQYRAVSRNTNESDLQAKKNITTISGLHFGTEYEFSVAFIGSGGVGPSSSNFTAMTTQDGKETLHILRAS